MDDLNKSDEKRPEVESAEPLSEERLDQVSGGTPKAQEYLKYDLTEVYISNISTSGGGGGNTK
jgi:hypothetical protein